MWETELDEGILIASWNNPPHNYYTPEGYAQLEKLADQCADPEIRAVVLTGALEGSFVTHFAIDAILSGQQAPLESRVAAGGDRNLYINQILDRFTSLQKPVIAGLNGDAMGFGFILALACDVRIAQQGDYRYGLPEVRLGIVPSGSGVQRLARLVGQGAAMRMALGAEMFTPDEALRVGAVHEVVPDAKAAAIALAKQWAKLPARALGLTKRALYRGMDLPFKSAVEMESELAYQARLSHEAAEAMSTYLSKASPAEARAWLIDEE